MSCSSRSQLTRSSKRSRPGPLSRVSEPLGQVAPCRLWHPLDELLVGCLGVVQGHRRLQSDSANHGPRLPQPGRSPQPPQWTVAGQIGDRSGPGCPSVGCPGAGGGLGPARRGAGCATYAGSPTACGRCPRPAWPARPRRRRTGCRPTAAGPRPPAAPPRPWRTRRPALESGGGQRGGVHVAAAARASRLRGRRPGRGDRPRPAGAPSSWCRPTTDVYWDVLEHGPARHQVEQAARLLADVRRRL